MLMDKVVMRNSKVTHNKPVTYTRVSNEYTTENWIWLQKMNTYLELKDF